MTKGDGLLILICGDRNWSNADAIARELKRFDPQVDVIMHGGARGADSIAGALARERGFVVHCFPAHWDRYGSSAGPIRNREMLAQKPDRVLAFHADLKRSRGTKDMVNISRKAGIEVKVFES